MHQFIRGYRALAVYLEPACYAIQTLQDFWAVWAKFSRLEELWELVEEFGAEGVVFN